MNDMTEYMVDDVIGVAYADSQIQFTAGTAAQFQVDH